MYKITLSLTEQELNILWDSLSHFSVLGEETTNYTSSDVHNLLEKVEEMYIEENATDYSTEAAKAFINQFGIDELLENREKWEGFRNAYCNKNMP